MRPVLAAAAITLAAGLALAAPPIEPHPPRPGGSGHPEGAVKPGFKPGDGHPDRPGRGDRPEMGGPGGPRPFGSGMPMPSGSAFGRAANVDGGAPRPRAERAAQHRQKLRARFGQLFHAKHAPQGLANEMTRHAQRVARIERVRNLAEQAKDSDGVARADALLAKENQRHERWLTRQPPAPGIASAAAPAGSAP